MEVWQLVLGWWLMCTVAMMWVIGRMMNRKRR
jgi:hypothetical protein